MSGPTRQRSLKERLREGIALPLQRRRSSQSSGGKLTSKSYVINTDSKTSKVAENYGVPHNNLPEWSSTMNSTKKSDEMISLHQQRLKDPSLAIAEHKLLFKSPSEPVSQHDASDEREKRQVARTMTQPVGTTTYTVKSSDTLTSIAARFDTTPSELVKLNRLVSRLIFPGQVLYVPDKSLASFDESTDTEGGPAVTNQVTDLTSAHQASPKPGHVERVQSPIMSPTINPLTEEEERNLDRECIEKFLKINVRHITDGQGVVGGVLLVTPNNVMFDPNVSDPLVIEHGPEKYGVIAPMDYVINAAMYNDIATMYVSHAPDRSVQPQPEVYHAKECLLSWQSTLSAPSWRPYRSDSEQAVNGSVSDMAEAGTPEEDRASLSSCQTPGSSALQNSDSTANLDSEVFLEENPQSSASPTVSRKDPTDSSGVHQKCSADSVDRIDSLISDTDNTERNLSEVEVDDIKHDATVCPESSELPNTKQKSASNDEPLVPVVTKANIRNNSVTSETDKKIVQDGAAIPITDPPPPPLPLDSSPKQQPNPAAAAAPSEQVLKESLTRKNSSSALDNKMKVLKRLSYPLTWMESFSSSEKDKENAPPLGSLTEVSISNATSSPSLVASQTQTQQSTFSKILYSSPKTLVDFSSGLFMRSSDDVVKDQVQPPKAEAASTRDNTIVPDIPSAPSASVSPIPPTAVIKPGKTCLISETNTVQANQRAASFPQRRMDANVVFVPKPRTVSSDYRCHSVAEGVREPKVGFKSVVSVDDMPDLFASIDQLIPRPAKPCDDPPLYLCLRMGIPLNKKLPKNIPAMAYGKKCMKREYWFSIPRDRVDELYSFFNHWAPNVYGDLDEKAINERGFVLIVSEEEISDDESQAKDVIDGSSGTNTAEDAGLSQSYTDWEVITTLDLRKQMSIDAELPTPDLIGRTDILTEDHRKSISKHLPARAVGYAWSLIYSTSQHGFSLNNLYRKCSQYETPILLTIMDTEDNVFGALTACSLRLSDHFYGTGESFLFTFHPEFQIFNWTGENNYFIKGNNDCLAIGSGDGVFGLWLDGDLYNGRSHPCKTYNNTMLTNKEDFHVQTLEAWGFVEVDTSA